MSSDAVLGVRKVPLITSPIRVLIGDSTHMNRELLKTALARYRVLNVASCTNADEQVIATALQHEADVLCISYDASNGGPSALRRITGSLPEKPVVVMVDECTERGVVEAFRAGARGVFRRSDSVPRLVRCISAVHSGQVWATSSDLIAVLQALSSAVSLGITAANGEELLTPREQEITRLVAEGLTNQEIGDALKISGHTVKNYLFKIYDKLGISTRVELILYAASPRPKG